MKIREQQLKTIYKEIANKDLTFGCRIKRIIFKDYQSEDDIDSIFTHKTRYSDISENTIYRFHMHELYSPINTDTGMMTEKEFSEHYKIIGHPILIGDVLDWIEKNNIEEKEYNKIVERKGKNTQFTYCSVNGYIEHYWAKKRLPIEEQSDECIEYIYNLLQND